jgi:hypothetical protein
MQKTALQQRQHQNKIETIEGKNFFLLYCHSLALYEVASTLSNLILQNLLQITGPYSTTRQFLRRRILVYVLQEFATCRAFQTSSAVFLRNGA